MTTDTDKASDKLVEMALKEIFEKGWCAAAQWAQRDDLRHDTGSIAYAGQRDAILAGKAAEVHAAIIADLCWDVEPVAFMFQHSETGRVIFVDAWQKENGWAAANPRYSEVGALHGASTVATLKAERDALREKLWAQDVRCGKLEIEKGVLKAQVAELEKYAGRYRWLRDEGNPYAILVVGNQEKTGIKPFYGIELDAAIDAALTKGQQ